MSEHDWYFLWVLGVLYLTAALWFTGVTLGLEEDSDDPTWLLCAKAALLGLFWPMVLAVGSGIAAAQKRKK